MQAKAAAAAALTAACVVSIMLPARAADVFRGLGGAEIVACIAREYSPQRVVNAVDGPDGILAIVGEYAGEGADWLPLDADSGSAAVPLAEVVPTHWWPAPLRPSSSDLHNLIPAGAEAAGLRGILIFGDASADVLFSGSGWALCSVDAGGGVMADAFVAPSHLRGDFARVLMYMLCVYPSDMWLWPAPLMMLESDSPLPQFTPYGEALMMKWHRDDPPDDAERRRDSAISRRQGNSNPFVLRPELAEYLWGERRGMVVGDAPGADGGSPPLKARYSIAADVVLGLHSPYVGEDMIWSLDGRDVSADIPLAEAGIGRHEIGWRSTDGRVRGSMIIDVGP